MTKRYTEELREAAESGDETARETLRGAGLWSEEGEEEEAAAAYAASRPFAAVPSLIEIGGEFAALPARARAAVIAELEAPFGEEDDDD